MKTLEELYAELDGKTERTEIEAVMKEASIAVLKVYLKYEGGYKAYDGMSEWRKAEYVEAATELTMDKIDCEEVSREILIGGEEKCQ